MACKTLGTAAVLRCMSAMRSGLKLSENSSVQSSYVQSGIDRISSFTSSIGISVGVGWACGRLERKYDLFSLDKGRCQPPLCVKLWMSLIDPNDIFRLPICAVWVIIPQDACVICSMCSTL